MLYNAANPLDVENARLRLASMVKRRAIFELTERKGRRTLRQNSYLWVTLAYWGAQTGYRKDEAEAVFKHVNRDTFRRTMTIGGVEVEYVRHIAELDTAEMSLAIDRWRDWAARNEDFPVYIPSPDEKDGIAEMEYEVSRAERYL
ncbi:MAG: hypothetical protein LUC44_06120 [Prevotellaceae bacterium]|nr:hypothetical protein [Prevotellaceae bacterium]